MVAFIALCVAAIGAQNPAEPPKGTGLIVGQVVDAVTGRGVADVAVTPFLISKAPPAGGSAGGRGAILTDSDGHFVFRELAAGSYTLIGRRSGYLDSAFGAMRQDSEGQPIVVADGGKVGGIALRLWRPAAISGTVMDESGEPLIGVQVRAVKRILTSGQWRLGTNYSFQNRGRTDDRGAYRLADLSPGDYVVLIEATATSVPRSIAEAVDAMRLNPAMRDDYNNATQSLSAIGALVALGSTRNITVGDSVLTVSTEAPLPLLSGTATMMRQTQFYPAALSASAAQVIPLKAGDEYSGVDFSLRSVRSFRISGTVTGADGPVSRMPLHLVRADGSALLADIDTSATISAADGSFTFLGVPAGDYVVKAIRFPAVARISTQVGNTTRSEAGGRATSEPTLWANVPVSVGDADTTGVTVTLATGARLSGRVVFNGATPPTARQMATFSFSISGADGSRLGSRSDDSTVRVTGDTFVTPELPPGSYLLGPNSGPVEWTLSSLVVSGRDVTDKPIAVEGRDISGITVTFTDRAEATVTGMLRAGAGTQPPNATVLVFPAEREAWTNYGLMPRRLRRVRPAKTGQYTVESLPPGEYLVAAIADDGYPDWRDPRYLDALARVASRVAIVSGSPSTLDLTIVRVSVANRAPAALPRAPVEQTIDSLVDGGPYVADADQQQPVRDNSSQTPVATGTAVVTGKVVADTAAAVPVRGVIITLSSAEPRVARTTVTDDTGRFTFDQLPAGRYALIATKPGFITTSYGASRPGRPGTSVSVADGATADLIMKLPRGGVITGVIRDERGQPIPGASVQTYRYQFSNGRRALAQVFGQNTPSDDRGMYRVFGLDPGSYLVAVDRLNLGVYRNLPRVTTEDWRAAEREVSGAGSAPTGTTANAPALVDAGYVHTFYPGTPVVSEATLLTVGSGEERSGIDIAVPVAAMSRILATVTGPDGTTPPTVQARLQPAAAIPGSANTNLEAGLMIPISDGKVTISGVHPGEYTLHVGGSSIPTPRPASGSFAVAFSSDRSIGLPMWAMVPVTVSGRDVTLQVQLEPARVVSGRVVFDGQTPPPAMTSVRFQLVGPNMGGASLSTMFLPLSAEGTFRFEGILPAAYRVAGAPPRGWMIASAMMNGKDAADLPVEISADVTDAVVTYTDRLAKLSGTLQTPDGTPASAYFVIIFARDSAYWLPSSRRIVSVRPSTAGQFVASGLPPGQYLIAAVTDVESGEWFDPEFLKQLVSAAVPLTIAEGEQKVQDVRIK